MRVLRLGIGVVQISCPDMRVKTKLGIPRDSVDERWTGMTVCRCEGSRLKLWGEHASIPHIWRFGIEKVNMKSTSFPQKIGVFHS